jgi:hypothetical protein
MSGRVSFVIGNGSTVCVSKSRGKLASLRGGSYYTQPVEGDRLAGWARMLFQAEIEYNIRAFHIVEREE